MEFLQKFPYIFSTFLPMAAFFALGLWIAWWVWYRHAKALKAAYATNGKLTSEFETLNTRQQALSARAIALAGRGGEWRQKLDKREADFVSLKGDFDGIKGEADKLKTELSVKEKDFGALNLKFKDLGSEKDNEISGLVNKLSGFETDLSGRDDDLKKLRAEIGSASDAKSKLEADLGKRDAELDKLRAEIGSSGDAKAKLEADLGKRDTELNKLRSEIGAAGDAKAKLEADLGKRDADLEKLRSEIGAAGDAKAKLEADLGKRDTELNKLRSEIGAAGDAKTNLEADLGKRDTELNELRSEIGAAGDAKTNLEADLGKRDTELNELRSEIGAAGDAKAKLEADLGRRDADLDKLRAEIEAKTKTAAALEAQAAKLDDELKGQRNEFAGLKKDFAAKGAELDGAQKAIGERDQKIAKLTSTFDGERKQWDGKVKGLTGDVSARDASVRELEAKLKEAAKQEAQLAKLQASIDDREKSIAKLKGQLSDKDSSLTSLKGDISSRDKQLSTAEAQVQKKESEREKLAAELEKWRNRANDTSKQDALTAEIQGLKSSVAENEAALAEERDKATRAASGLSLFDGEDVSEDKALGLVYKKKPDTVDDLKRISGVGGVLEGKLHNSGVYRFKQIALWDQERLETFSDRLDFKGRVEREMWVHQACDFHNADYGERLRPMTDIYRQPMTRTVKGSDPAAVDAAFEGEDVSRDESLGVIYKKRPDEVDDLKEISGVAKVLEGKLHDFGIYRFKQIALWQRDQIDTFSDRLNFPDRIDRDMWVHQAVDLHFDKHDEHLTPQVPIYRKPEVRTRTSTVIKMDTIEPAGPAGFVGEAVTEDPKLGVVYTSRPDEVDDLKRIKGVANVLEGKLHAFGVYRFKQIAMWSPEVIAEFSERLSFRDRVERDNWKGQAATFHEEEYGEKVAGAVSMAKHDLAAAT